MIMRLNLRTNNRGGIPNPIAIFELFVIFVLPGIGGGIIAAWIFHWNRWICAVIGFLIWQGVLKFSLRFGGKSKAS